MTIEPSLKINRKAGNPHQWLESRVGLVTSSLDRYRHQVGRLEAQFGKKLITEITWEDVVSLQQNRRAEGRSRRTVNYEVGTLRSILKSWRLWAPIGERVKALRQRRSTLPCLRCMDFP